MQRIKLIMLLIIVSMSFLCGTPAFCWWWGNSLVTIDGVRYSTDDFKTWWKYWNDTNFDLPKTVQPYLDWLLLAREGERMDLTSDPSFERDTYVFLQVRSLILLQKEEIYDKIQISDAELKAKYQELFTPLWLLQRLEFNDKAAAESARQELAAGAMTIDELIKRSSAEGGPVTVREDWRRPNSIDPGWADRFRKLTVGQTTEPVPFDEFYIVYRLKEQREGDDEDFAKLKDRLKDMLYKEKEEVVTKDLIDRLQRKFEVSVDHERLAALSLTESDDAYSDAPIITTNRQNVSEKDFIYILRKDSAFRNRHNMDETGVDELKQTVLNGILGQNLTNWEALDRHYEEREPLKQEYLFNINHRLTRELERRLFVPESKVTPDEIKSYFQANLSRYSQPELVRIAIVEDTDGVVDKIWGDVLTGKSFAKAVKEHTDKELKLQDYPYNHLDPVTQKVVDGLAKGETSQPFSSRGGRFILELVSRTAAKPIPLGKVSENIRTKLEQEKLTKKRNEYLDQVKSRSQIEINESAWQAVQKELGVTK